METNLKNFVQHVPKLCVENVLKKLLKIIFILTALNHNTCVSLEHFKHEINN